MLQRRLLRSNPTRLVGGSFFGQRVVRILAGPIAEVEFPYFEPREVEDLDVEIAIEREQEVARSVHARVGHASARQSLPQHLDRIDGRREAVSLTVIEDAHDRLPSSDEAPELHSQPCPTLDAAILDLLGIARDTPLEIKTDVEALIIHPIRAKDAAVADSARWMTDTHAETARKLARRGSGRSRMRGSAVCSARSLRRRRGEPVAAAPGVRDCPTRSQLLRTPRPGRTGSPPSLLTPRDRTRNDRR